MEIRERIQERLNELGLSQAWLAAKLGKSRGYLTDYFVKKKPKELSLELRVKAADALGLPRKDLGADMSSDTHMQQLTGFRESDVELYVPTKGHYLSSQPHVIYYRVKTMAMDMGSPPLQPGMIIRIDINRSQPQLLKQGQIVVGQRMSRHEGLGHKETILRVFLPPDKLCTNSSGLNQIERIDDRALGTNVVIRGTMVSYLGDIDGDRQHDGTIISQ